MNFWAKKFADIIRCFKLSPFAISTCYDKAYIEGRTEEAVAFEFGCKDKYWLVLIFENGGYFYIHTECEKTVETQWQASFFGNRDSRSFPLGYRDLLNKLLKGHGIPISVHDAYCNSHTTLIDFP